MNRRCVSFNGSKVTQKVTWPHAVRAIHAYLNREGGPVTVRRWKGGVTLSNKYQSCAIGREG